MIETVTVVSTSENIILSGDGLTVDDVLAVARGHARVGLDADALVRVRAARDVVDRVLASGESVYGLNTGLGSLSRHHIPLEEIGAFAFATVADQVSFVWSAGADRRRARDDGVARQRDAEGWRRGPA